MDLGTLEVNIGADLSGLNRGLRKAQSKIKNATRKIKRAAQGATVALGAIGTAAVAASQHTANYAKEVQNSADVTDTSTDTFQELSYALQQVGARQEDAYEGLIELNRVMGEAIKGDKRATEALDTVGISMEQVKDESFSTIDAFMKSVRALNDIESQAVKTDAAAILFSEDVSRRLLPAVEQGADEIQRMMQRAQELGIVMDEDAINAAVKYRDSVKELQQSLGAAVRVMGSQFIPVMNDVVNRMTQAVVEFNNLPESTKNAMTQFIGFTSAVLGGVAALGLVAVAVEAAMAGLGLLGSMFTAITSPVVLGGLAIAAAASMAFEAWNKNWGGIRDEIVGFAQNAKKKFEQVIPELKNISQFVQELAGAVLGITVNLGGKLLDWFANDAWPFLKDKVLPFTVDVTIKGIEMLSKAVNLMRRLKSMQTGKQVAKDIFSTEGISESTRRGEGVKFEQGGGQTLPGWFRFLPGFQSGGMTANVGKSNPAGVVHGGEWVMPAWMVDKMPGVVGMLENIRSRGYKSGGAVGNASFAGMNFEDMKGWLDGIKEGLANTAKIVAGAFKQLAKVLQKVFNVVGQKLGFGKLGDKLNKVIAGFDDLFSATGDNTESQNKSADASFSQAKAVKKAADQANKFKEYIGDTLSNLGSKIKNETMIGDVMQGAKKGGQAAGPQGAAVGAITEVLKNSKQFGQFMEILTQHLQTVANAFGMLLEPILPLVSVIQSTLAPIFKTLGSILKGLITPAMKALFPVVKYLGIALTTVTLGILKTYNFFAGAVERVVNGIISFVNNIPGVDFGKVSLTIDTSRVEKSLENLKDASYDSASSIKDEKKEREELNQTIRNSVSGFKIALERFRVSNPKVPSAAVGGTVKSGGIAQVHRGEVIMNQGQQAAAGGITVQIQGDVYGMNAFERKVNEAVQKADRKRKLSSNGLART